MECSADSDIQNDTLTSHSSSTSQDDLNDDRKTHNGPTQIPTMYNLDSDDNDLKPSFLQRMHNKDGRFSSLSDQRISCKNFLYKVHEMIQKRKPEMLQWRNHGRRTAIADILAKDLDSLVASKPFIPRHRGHFEYTPTTRYNAYFDTVRFSNS